MIIGLVTDKDRDMRTMGLQQIREEAKGPAATQRFVSLLPKLPAESQAGLLEALGDRGDKTARPAILAMLKSPDEQVRAAAALGLGSLGEAADVAPLAQSLAASGPEKMAARTSLTRLRGQDIDAAIVGELKRAKPDIQAGLLAVLARAGPARAYRSSSRPPRTAMPACAGRPWPRSARWPVRIRPPPLSSCSTRPRRIRSSGKSNRPCWPSAPAAERPARRRFSRAWPTPSLRPAGPLAGPGSLRR